MAKQLRFEYELGGEKRVLNFGYLCWEIYCETMDIGPDEIVSVLKTSKSFKAMRTLIYSAIRAQQMLDKSTIIISEDDIIPWINDDFDKVQEIFYQAAGSLIEKTNPAPIKEEKKSRSRSTK